MFAKEKENSRKINEKEREEDLGEFAKRLPKIFLSFSRLPQAHVRERFEVIISFFFVKQWCRVGNEGDGANSRGKQLLAFIFRRTERENTTKEEERKKISLFNASDAHAPVVPYVYPTGEFQ